MRRGVPQVRFIQGRDPHETAQMFNETMTELAELNPTYEREGDSFWVYYKVDMYSDEEIFERVTTTSAHCEDCPYIMRDLNRFGNIDARKKWATCGKTGERVHMESKACDIYDSLSERRKI